MVHPHHGPRALVNIEGEPLIRRALSTRAWRAALRPQDYVFVVRAAPGADEIMDYLRQTWPGCGILVVPHVTDGAMLSVLAGIAVLPAGSGPVVVDLADILFDGGPSPEMLEAWPQPLGGMAPWFPSTDPKYSYLRIVEDRVEEAAEKRVISDAASAGVYFFRDPQVYVAAAAHSLAHREALAHKGSLFVCPMFNGVACTGLAVRPVPVSNVRPVGAMFHAS